MTMETKENNRLVEEINRLRESLSQKDQEIENLRTGNLFPGALFDGINEEIMVVDPDFNIKDANRTFLKRYGLKKADVIGQKCYEIKERSNAPCSIEDKSCPLESAGKTGKRVEMIHYHKHADGKVKEFILNMYPFKPGGEKIEYFIETARDVSDYRDLIRKLQSSEKKFRAILDTATNAILSIDENNKIILFNNAAQRIFGYSREEILGKNLNLLIPAQYGDHYRFVRRFLKKRESDIIGKTISLTALRKDGEEFPIELSLSFLEMDSGITFTAIIRDNSGQRKLERKLLQSERLAAVGQAAAHVAHELKNPLMIIGGFSGQIKKNLTDDRDLKKLDMILDEVRRLERLVAHLGDFTKVYRLVKRPSDINAAIKDVIKIMAGLYPTGKYSFKEFFSPDIEEITCDPDKLKQVLINVISNGIEAMADGGIITVSTEKISEGIEIRFSDEGTGIPEEDLEHIFEPFYTTRERGSVLGLSVSYKIIEAHHGDISAVSLLGKGTTFIIRLPLS